MEIRALVFDVFGTVVDWRGSIVREGEALGARKGLKVDWPVFADAWRAEYQPAMAQVRKAVRRTWWFLAAVGAVTLVLGLSFAFWLSRWATR